MDALERYIHDFSSPEEELLHELDRQTHLQVVQPRMLSGHIQGKLLELLVRMLRPRNILEIGTFTGYSALCMAAGLEEDGVLDTVEVDDELEEFAASFFRRSPHGQKIRQHIGSALDIVPTLGYTFDLVFIDGDKREYPDYYRMLMGDGGKQSVGAQRIDIDRRQHPLVGQDRGTGSTQRPPYAGAAGIQPHDTGGRAGGKRDRPDPGRIESDPGKIGQPSADKGRAGKGRKENPASKRTADRQREKTAL